MTTICIGPFCIPLYALIPFGLIVLNNLWEWFRRTVLGFDDKALFENSRVVHVKSVEQWKELQKKSLDTKRTLVVDFTASWCPPCRGIAPFFHELSNKYPCSIFLKVDVDEMSQIARENGITAMPTFHFFKNGKRCDEVRGASRQNLEDTVRRHYVEVELPEDDKPMEKKSCCDKEHNNVRQRKPLVTMIQSHEQWKEVHEKSKSTGKALIVDFTAKWCGPCQRIAPFFDELSGKYPAGIFIKVDVDEMEDIAAECNIKSMPTFYIYKNGKKVDTLNGAMKSSLESLVARYTA